MRALLQEARFVSHQHAIGAADVFDHVVPAEVARRILVPLHMAEHPLRAPGPGIADLFRQLPAVLALRHAQQGFEIQSRLPPWLGANEQRPKPLLQDIEVITPTQHTVCYYQSPPS
jgi:hypothetical protein